MLQWQHSNSNRAAQVKVSNDKACWVTVTWLVIGTSDSLLVDDLEPLDDLIRLAWKFGRDTLAFYAIALQSRAL